MKKNKGFSLIEIVVVLAIIGVIAAFLTPMLFNYMSDSKTRRAQNDVQQIAAAIGRFNIDTGVYPTFNDLPPQSKNSTITNLYTNGNDADLTGTDATWVSTDTNASALQDHLEKGISKNATSYNDATKGVKSPNQWKGPYMSDFKADPWGNKYYVSAEGMWPGSSKTAFVLSAGPNGKIETAISQQSGTTSAFVAGGDDIAYRIK